MNNDVQNYFSAVIKRYDDDGITKYYHYSEFPGLTAQPFSFLTPDGNRIKGYVYAYEKANNPSLIVFCHGLGGGHRSYMKEIATICREGYRVVGFDNVGCFESSGDSILGISEAVYDINCCLDFLETQKDYKALPKILIGHSQGAYAALTALHFHREIKKCVALACFNGIRDFLSAYLHIQDENSMDTIMNAERKRHPDIADLQAADILASTQVPTLLIHAEDDIMIPIGYGMQKIQEATDNACIGFITVHNKKHLPHYSKEAVSVLYSFFDEYTKKTANGELDTKAKQMAFMQNADWDKMTQQDETVWQTVFRFLAE